MTRATILRFRRGLKAKRYTLKEVSDATGVPITTLSDMSKEGWGKTLFDRLELLETALNCLEAEGTAKKSKEAA